MDCQAGPSIGQSSRPPRIRAVAAKVLCHVEVREGREARGLSLALRAVRTAEIIAVLIAFLLCDYRGCSSKYLA